MSTPAAGAAGTSAGLTEEQLRERGIAKMDQEMRRKFARGGKFNFKIVLRGDSSTGKSTLLRRLRGGTFQPDYNPTPEIRTAHVQWQARSNPEDNIMLEVWDVIDKASKRAISESLTLAHNVDETAEGRHTFPLDATMVDVYHGCHAAIFLIDPSKKWTYEYVQRELATVPEHIPTCVVLNFRDYPASKRLIRLEEVEADMEYSFGKRPFRPFVMEASLLNCYGLQALSTFLHIPFLCLKRASLEQAMQLNTHAIVQAQEAMRTVRANSYDAYERKIDATTGGSNVSNAQGEAASAGTPGQPPARQSHAAPPTAKEAAITWEKLSNTTLGEAPLLIGGAAIGAAVTGVTAVASLTPAQIAENVKSVASVGNVAKAIGLGPKEKKGHYVDEPVEKVAPQFSHLTGRGGAAAAAFGGGAQLHHDVRVVRRRHHLLQLDDVRVVELAQNFDLGLERLEVLLVGEVTVLDDLDRVVDLLLEVHRLQHLGEAAAAERGGQRSERACARARAGAAAAGSSGSARSKRAALTGPARRRACSGSQFCRRRSARAARGVSELCKSARRGA